MAECVGRKDVENTLEGMEEVSVLDSTKPNDQTEFVKRKVSKLDNKMPECGTGIYRSSTGREDTTRLMLNFSLVVNFHPYPTKRATHCLVVNFYRYPSPRDPLVVLL